MPTLLLLDDNALVRDVLCEALERHGFEVIAAADPLKAIEAAENHRGDIDIALLDVAVPHMRCGKCAECLREIHPALKVVYMSGYPLDIAREMGGLEHNSEFVMKPFTPDALIGTLRRVLCQSPGNGKPGSTPAPSRKAG